MVLQKALKWTESPPLSRVLKPPGWSLLTLAAGGHGGLCPVGAGETVGTKQMRG